jgi:hypothetical protein
MTSANAKSKEIATALIDRESRTQKYRYGAWYLPKNLWQRSLITKELIDPKVIKAEREDTTRKREEEIVKIFHVISTNLNQLFFFLF